MRIALLPGQNRDIWSLACPSGLPTLHHWCQKSSSRNRCKLYQGYAQQYGHSTRHCGQQMDCWHQAFPVRVSTCSRVPPYWPGWSFTPFCFTNDPINEDKDADDWLDRTMSFAVVLMNSRPSWSSRLNSSYHLTRATSYRLISRWPSCQKKLPTYSIYLEDK